MDMTKLTSAAGKLERILQIPQTLIKIALTVLLVLSWIFAYGAQLQQQSDETL